MKIYLSGKITGDVNYRQKFGSMEKELLILSRCDAIFLMRDWKNSPGANREYEEAKCLGLRILTEEDFRIRRTLVQLCRDSKRLAEIEHYDEEGKRWTKPLKAVKIERNGIQDFTK